MSVRILLDRPSIVFTSLDVIQGRVIVDLEFEESISSITVKLEGASRSRLFIPKDENDTGLDPIHKTEVEFHKFLYVVDTVFPPPGVPSKGSGYKIKAGEHEYPFSIKIPIKSQCTGTAGIRDKLSFDLQRGAVDYAKESTSHHIDILPPSLSGIVNDDAWIRYYLKATVNKPQFYKQNLRQIEFLVFLPIEPPRPATNTKAEVFAKREYQFRPELARPPKKGLFSAFHGKDKKPTVAPGPPPKFGIEVRLPSPAILVPKDPLPLRILILKQEPYNASIFIRSIQLVLISYTTIRAHSCSRVDATALPFFGRQDLQHPVGDEEMVVGTETEIDPQIWAAASLPDTVAPTFQTCNIARRYELEVNVGISSGPTGTIDTIPFTLPVEVYSGIIPPPALLQAATIASNRLNPNLPVQRLHPGSTPSSPISPSVGRSNTAPFESFKPDSNAPPTYEDAMAADIGPIDGPMRDRTFPQSGSYFTGADEVEGRMGGKS